MPWDNIIDYWPLLILVPSEYVRRRLLPVARAIHFLLYMLLGVGFTLSIYPSLSGRHQLYAIAALVLMGLVSFARILDIRLYRKHWEEWQGIVDAYSLTVRTHYFDFNVGAHRTLEGPFVNSTLYIRLLDEIDWDDNEDMEIDITLIELRTENRLSVEELSEDLWDMLLEDAKQLFGVDWVDGDVTRQTKGNYIRIDNRDDGGKLRISLTESYPDPEKIVVLIDGLWSLANAVSENEEYEEDVENTSLEPEMGKKKNRIKDEAQRKEWGRRIEQHTLNENKSAVFDVLDTIFPDAHPVDAAAVKAGILEPIADGMASEEPEMAAWLYELTEENLRILASSASGQGDGRSMMADVQAVIDKRERLDI